MALARGIPLSKLTIIDGDPGLGKSVLTLDLAARVSRGVEMPDGAAGRQGGVVLLTAEDGIRDTVVPRLDAAGADRSRVLALDLVPDAEGGQQLPRLPLDAPYIDAAVRRMGALLVVVDPLTAYLSERINSHRDQDCRRALWPLTKLAEETGAAVVVVRHLNKGNASNPLYRGGGSIGIIGAARSGLLVARSRQHGQASSRPHKVQPGKAARVLGIRPRHGKQRRLAHRLDRRQLAHCQNSIGRSR